MVVLVPLSYVDKSVLNFPDLKMEQWLCVDTLHHL